MDNGKQNENEQKNKNVKINKKLRLWNKYRNYVIMGAGILVVLIIVAGVLKGTKGKDNDIADNLASTQDPQISQTDLETSTETTTGSASADTQPAGQTQQAPSQAGSLNKVLTVSKPLNKEDFNTSSFYEDSVFLGDFVVNGISYYGYLGNNKVISDTNLTINKASGYIDQIAAAAPKKVFIMLGINDLNYGSKSVESMAQDYGSLIGQMKAKLPEAKIYVLSVLPITRAYESKSNVYIRKTNIEELNNKLKTMIEQSGFTFVDLNPVFQNNEGYLADNVTSNGLNIVSGYYGYLLNAIADILK